MFVWSSSLSMVTLVKICYEYSRVYGDSHCFLWSLSFVSFAMRRRIVAHMSFFLSSHPMSWELGFMTRENILTGRGMYWHALAYSPVGSRSKKQPCLWLTEPTLRGICLKGFWSIRDSCWWWWWKSPRRQVWDWRCLTFSQETRATILTACDIEGLGFLRLIMGANFPDLLRTASSAPSFGMLLASVAKP